MARKILAGGAWIQVLLNGAAGGLSTEASYDDDWAVNPANVLNYHGPSDYGWQGYACTVPLSTFVPERPGEGPWPDGGQVALAEFIPTRGQVPSSDGKPGEC